MKIDAMAKRHPVAVYFGLTFIISWGGAFALLAPRYLRGETIPVWYALVTFPVMLLGPSLAGIGLTAAVDGRAGLSDLFARMVRWRVGLRSAGVAVLLPPAIMLVTLFFLSATVSPVFQPRVFLLGGLFGPIAGFLEEIGWTGFAFPRLQARFGTLRGSLLLGLIWGLWHAPIIDYLGTASPHGAFLVPFFLGFIAVVTPMRVLIGWLALSGRSVFVAQVMHASMTGFLAMLSPSGVSSAQEAAWYLVYGITLWFVVVGVATTSRSSWSFPVGFRARERALK